VLSTIARALRGAYFDVNEKHLPTDALGDMVVRTPLPKSGLNLAQWAVLAMALGAVTLALLPVALQYLGSRWRVAPAGGGAGEGVVR
jgi:hypothetical protein